MKKLVFIGGINQKNAPRGGEEAKNQKLVKYLKTLNKSCTIIDTHNWKFRFPSIVLCVLKDVVFKSNQKIILSASDESAFKLMLLLIKFGVLRKNEMHYFVIGGDFSNQLAKNKLRLAYYNQLTGVYPESKKMLREAKDLGLNNLAHVPNFREVPAPISKKQLTEDAVIHFVYLARVTPDKGSELVLDACERLNQKGLQSQYKVHFYGFFHPDTDNYQARFMNRLQQIPNLSYKGFLDVNTQSGFDTLYNYDLLLFPTYWATEGYSGTLIDALSAGLPAIASDWNYNSEIIQNDYNGKLIKPKSVRALGIEMENIILNPSKILEMSSNACESAKSFDISHLMHKTVFAED